MAKKKNQMTDADLLALIGSRKKQGLNAEGGDLTQTRQEILNQYLGEPYGDERAGLSKVISRDVLETVEWAMPSLMKIFAGDDLIVAFEATGPEDEDQARQETEYLNHVFKKQNNGFMVLHDFIKDALLSPTAYAKVWHEECEKVTTETYKGLVAQDLVKLDEDTELEPVGQDSYVKEVLVQHPQTGQPTAVAVEMFDVEYKRTTTGGRCRVESVPPEELIIDAKITSLDLSDADFICHTTDTTKSDLLDMGFKKSIVDGLSSIDNYDDEEKSNRAKYTDEENIDNDNRLKLEESYILVDWEGSGKTERRRVLSVGNTVLSNEPDDYIPFVAMSSVKIPHRHTGLAFAELVADLQRIKTTLTRQMLNNLYRVNNPRPIVGMGVNMQDLLNDAPNAPIRARDINDIRMEPTSPVIGQVLPTLQHFNEVQNSRSGVSSNTRGVDPSALAETTRGAYLGNLEQANQRLEMLARMFAETGIKQIFLKLHENTLRYQEGVVQYKINGNWTQVDPAEWRTRENMTVVVGIGYGTKEQQLVALQQLQIAQEKLATAGSALVSPQNIFNLLAKQAELANTGDPGKYFTDPSTMSPEQLNPQQEGEEDALAAAQMEMAKVEREKANLEHQRDMMKMEQDNYELQRKFTELQAKYNLEERKLDQVDERIENEAAKILLDSEHKEATLEQSRQAEINKAQMSLFPEYTDGGY